MIAEYHVHFDNDLNDMVCGVAHTNTLSAGRLAASVSPSFASENNDATPCVIEGSNETPGA